jgi:hypothetical protein
MAATTKADFIVDPLIPRAYIIDAKKLRNEKPGAMPGLLSFDQSPALLQAMRNYPIPAIHLAPARIGIVTTQTRKPITRTRAQAYRCINCPKAEADHTQARIGGLISLYGTTKPPETGSACSADDSHARMFCECLAFPTPTNWIIGYGLNVTSTPLDFKAALNLSHVLQQEGGSARTSQ